MKIYFGLVTAIVLLVFKNTLLHKVRECFTFDGVNDYVQLSTSGSVSTYTIEAG